MAFANKCILSCSRAIFKLLKDEILYYLCVERVLQFFILTIAKVEFLKLLKQMKDDTGSIFALWHPWCVSEEQTEGPPVMSGGLSQQLAPGGWTPNSNYMTGPVQTWIGHRAEGSGSPCLPSPAGIPSRVGFELSVFIRSWPSSMCSQKRRWGVSSMNGNESDASMRTQIWSLASISGLRILCCFGCAVGWRP